jgi:hypothetical protein
MPLEPFADGAASWNRSRILQDHRQLEVRQHHVVVQLRDVALLFDA